LPFQDKQIRQVTEIKIDLTVMESLLLATIFHESMTSKALFFHEASLTQNDNDIVYLDQNYVEYMLKDFW